MKYEKAANPHAGHRERMRERFQKDGLDHFQQHEILELLLFYALPRVNTNAIAHELIQRFHSLSGVLDADVLELKQVHGISENAAVFLKMIPAVCRQYQLDKMREHLVLDSMQSILDYGKAQFSGVEEERVLLMCLSESLELQHCETISKGNTQSALLDIHAVVACAIRMRSRQVVLAHNHPHAAAEFSDADLFATQRLRQVLRSMEIILLDHIVIGKSGDAVSMRQLMGWTD